MTRNASGPTALATIGEAFFITFWGDEERLGGHRHRQASSSTSTPQAFRITARRDQERLGHGVR